MKNRDINIDILKCLALFLVISVHFFHTGYYSLNFNLFVIPFIAIRNISMTCVPLFIIITGYLSWNKKWNKKYYLKLLHIWIIYSLCIFICTLIDKNFYFSLSTIHTAIKNIFTFQYYGWYVNMYLGLMLIAPLINLGYNSITRKKEKTF